MVKELQRRPLQNPEDWLGHPFGKQICNCNQKSRDVWSLEVRCGRGTCGHQLLHAFFKIATCKNKSRIISLRQRDLYRLSYTSWGLQLQLKKLSRVQGTQRIRQVNTCRINSNHVYKHHICRKHWFDANGMVHIWCTCAMWDSHELTASATERQPECLGSLKQSSSG